MASSIAVSTPSAPLHSLYENIVQVTGKSNVALSCMSYLTKNFDSIATFIDYFRNGETLRISKGNWVVIGNASLLTGRWIKEGGPSELQPTITAADGRKKMEETAHRACFFINKMFALIGKTAEWIGDIEEGSFQCGEDVFAVRAKSDCALKAVSGDPTVFWPCLLEMMAHCLIPQIRLAPDRQLHLVGSTGNLLKDRGIQRGGHFEYWEKMAPPGFQFKWVHARECVEYQPAWLINYCGTGMDHQVITLSNEQGNFGRQVEGRPTGKIELTDPLLQERIVKDENSKGLQLSLERTFDMAVETPLSYPNLVRVTESIGGLRLKFNDPNAIVVIEEYFGVSEEPLEIYARNLIVLPGVDLLSFPGGSITTVGSIVFAGANETQIKLTSKTGSIVTERGAKAAALVKTFAPAYADKVL
jgi:hypothetical protein